MQTGKAIPREQAGPYQGPLHAAGEDVYDGGNISVAAVRVTRILAASAALVTLATGVVVLFGWLLDIPSLKSVLPGFVTMKANTAVGFILAGVSLALLGRVGRSVRNRWLSQACAGITALLGLFTFSQYLFGLDLGIDQPLFRAPAGAVGTLFPGRMTPATAVNFLLLGGALFLAGFRRTILASQWLALLAGVIGWLALLGYLYGAPNLYGIGHYMQMAVHTAAVFIILGLGVLLAHPADGLMRTVTSDTMGRWLLRRLAPLAVAVPLILGWLWVQGERRHHLESECGIALMMLVLMVILVTMIFWTSRALTRIDTVRRQAEARLSESEGDLSITLHSIGDAVITTDTDGRVTRMNPVAEQLTGWPLAEAAGKPLAEVFRIINARTREPVADPLERALATGEIVSLANDTALIARDGTERQIADSAAPIRAVQGHIRGAVLVFHDVTAAYEVKKALRERVKELTCLQRVRDGLQAGISVEQLCQTTVEHLAQGMGYPEIAVSVIAFGDQRFTSGKSAEGLTHGLHADIEVAGGAHGRLSVFYVEDKPFYLPEEQHLVDAVAKILSHWLDRRRAEDEMRTLKTQIEFILGATKTGLDIVDGEFNVRYIDPEWQKVYGDHVGRKCYEYFMGRSDPCPGCGVVKALKDKTVTVTEKVLVKENSRPVQVTSMPFQNDQGEWLVAEVNVDITERKGMEHELRRLAVIVKQAAEGIAVADLDGNLQFVNDAWARMHGYESGAELVGMHLRVFHTDEQLKTEVEPFNATVKRQGHHAGEVGHVRRDGTTFPTQMSVVVLKDEQGEPYGLAAFAEDITRRKQAEQERRRLAAILEATPDFIGFADAKDAHILYINKGGRLMTGLTPDEDVTRLKISDIHPEWANRILMETVLPTAGRDGLWTGECAFLHRDGHEIPVLMALLAHKTSSGEVEVFSTISRDITEQKQAEDAIRQAKDQAEQANVAKSVFLANMSHEIRTPMTAIMGFTEELGNSIECCAVCPDHQACTTRTHNRESIQIIRRNGEHLLGLINDILDLSKVEAGKMELERVFCSPVRIGEDAVSLMRVRAIEKGLSLSARYEFPLPEAILVDPARVRQILVNLLGNAVKFTSRGRVEIVLRCTADVPAGRATIAFDVKDTGIGMTPEQIDRLFQPFAQADSSTTRQYGGTGLGLAISKRLAETMGGDIQVVSRTGEGSTFTFTMEAELATPVRMLNNISEVAEQMSRKPQSASSAAVKLGGRILLAEDGPDNQLLISTVIRRAGAEVDLAVNGLVAVDMALAARLAGVGYDVILMDMQMPEMDGYEATRKLRLAGYTGAIIALTAHAMAGDRARCIDAGCDDYATKPIDRLGLLTTLARLMGSSPAAAPQPAQADGEAIKSQFADDPEMSELIEAFIARLPETADAMAEALANNCFDELRRLAHQLKGSGGGYGYPSLTEQARKLEDSARAADGEAARLALDELKATVRAAVAGRDAGAAMKEGSR